MIFVPLFSRFIACALLCFAALSAPVLGAEALPEEALARDFPPQSITSVERANAALEAVPAVRDDVGNRFSKEKAACYQRFFVTSCLSELRVRERIAKKMVRRVEVEARAFLRKERAAERDRAIAGRESRAKEQGGKALNITGAARDNGEPQDASREDASNAAPAPADDASRR